MRGNFCREQDGGAGGVRARTFSSCFGIAHDGRMKQQLGIRHTKWGGLQDWPLTALQAPASARGSLEWRGGWNGHYA